ncbi:hypothetical protein ACTFTM_30070 [Micromonospora sp. RB23]
MLSENGLGARVLGAIRDSAAARADGAFADGYNEAANICVAALEGKIDGLMGQISANRYLSDQEQYLVASLRELKSNTERALRDFWNSADGE